MGTERRSVDRLPLSSGPFACTAIFAWTDAFGCSCCCATSAGLCWSLLGCFFCGWVGFMVIPMVVGGSINGEVSVVPYMAVTFRAILSFSSWASSSSSHMG